MLVLRSVCQERSFSLIFNWIFHLLITNFPILEDKKSSPKVDVYLAKKKHVSQHVNPPTCETFGRMRNAYKILHNKNNHDMYLEMYFTDMVRFLFALNGDSAQKSRHLSRMPGTFHPSWWAQHHACCRRVHRLRAGHAAPRQRSARLVGLYGGWKTTQVCGDYKVIGSLYKNLEPD